MNLKRFFLIFLVFSSTLALGIRTVAEDSKPAKATWKLIKNKKGVKIYARPRAGSKYRELLAKGKAKVAFEVGLELVKDCEHYFQWYGMCRELYVVKTNSLKDRIMYFVLDMPLVTDRDVVVRVTGDWDLKKRQGWINLKSVESDFKKDSGFVRMPALDGGFTFKETGKDEFFITYRVHADLGGNVPAWMVNIAAKKHPYETAVGARRQIQLEKYYKRAEKLHGKTFKRYPQP